MKHKRYWYVIVVLLLAIPVLLAACAEQPGGGQVDVETDPITEGENEGAEETVDAGNGEEAATPDVSGSLLIWLQQANQDVFEQTILDDFMAEYPDVEIEWVNYPPDEVASQLQVAIQGGTGGPDLAVIEHRDVPRLVELGGLLDLSDRLNPYMNQLNTAALQAGSADGRYYSFPWDVGPVVTFYRRDIFEAAGLPSEPEAVAETIATWEDFLEACTTIKEETGANCFAQNRANNIGEVYFNMLWQQELDWVSDDGQIVIDSPQHVATLEQLGQFWEADVVSDQQEWTDPWYAELNAPLDGGEVVPAATVTIGAWMGNFLKTWIAADQSGNWGVVPMPSFQGSVRSANQGGSAFVIPEQSSNPEAAWAFAEFMVGREDNHLAIFEYSDYFPALESTYDAPLFQEADPYFGEQVTREVFAEAGRQIPEVNIYVPQNNTITSVLQTAVQKYATGQASAEAALQEAAEAARLESGLD